MIPINIDLIACLRYYKNGILHRDDGPAIEWIHEPTDSMYVIRG